MADTAVKVWLEANMMILACMWVNIQCKPLLQFSAKTEVFGTVINSYHVRTLYF